MDYKYWIENIYMKSRETVVVKISSTNRIKISQNSRKYLCEEQENSVSGMYFIFKQEDINK